ncbi:undecaprenyl/decaprenyl-phosphate alpha-N-acetylglucosaminyl 1-phosphate transferase [Rummeliibacillus sp. G93]|uniref:Undecaprenyl-phosphate alpha-N-acetylglucosaminyl 1-phosphate transferase n=1 Tax=Rummeliibacillus stabekisii TaxID=241244 RepID=A0A143H8T4_9BACL|nr:MULTISPECIES: MraY family glycosyltransferase [Rummeliibacillus]AMW98122.1 undecaprenyl-phosphate alpha-N-acetylglucosaminyl 1-phosphate transferase [Rummeliibacillus stabekisii]MBB5170223.1 UDP-GlcNAc:undecaprenyl-phosphate GlcNAc-1-phosphate transferase [Rummeliibacillus stabekisii]MCM3315492.1 undecaprenyl/decaprenyl-phosphate alpha-N-acetylglucosaminyl 1-phosphate transferase [Rummeliibacillus stabekisii]UQW97992.1 undecaprenyl/decaprenyl-phosphate alpha-N-acetylglucosaminyl 1-phosphate 
MTYLALIVAFVASILLTPFVKKLAYRIGAVDKPNHRKVHSSVMPRLGGLAIFIAFLIGIAVAHPMDKSVSIVAILLGGFVIVITGALDDMLEITPKAKLLGQLAAALIVIFFGGVQIDFINLPFNGKLDFGYFSIPLTILWILAITNAINLIDGLDGLAAGVSTIALVTLAGMAFIMSNGFVLVIALILAASTCGFLFYNFHPAKIFMGDTGALFLGFMIAVLSLLGFKNVTFISLVIPIVMLGVPISDTFFAIVRRLLNKQPPFSPDKSHLHHRLMSLGFTHRQTVLLIYGIAAMFGVAAVTFSMATVWGAILLITVILIAIELFVEAIGLAGQNYRPLLNLVRRK